MVRVGWKYSESFLKHAYRTIIVTNFCEGGGGLPIVFVEVTNFFRFQLKVLERRKVTKMSRKAFPGNRLQYCRGKKLKRAPKASD